MKATKRPVAVHPDDPSTTANEVRDYAHYLCEHQVLMMGRRDLADVYDVASALVETFTLTGALVLTPDDEVHAYETARVALALAFDLCDPCKCTGTDYQGPGDDEAHVSFDAGDTFHEQEALSIALREIAVGIRDEAVERPLGFQAWQEKDRSERLAERAKRRGQR